MPGGTEIFHPKRSAAEIAKERRDNKKAKVKDASKQMRAEFNKQFPIGRKVELMPNEVQKMFKDIRHYKKEPWAAKFYLDLLKLNGAKDLFGKNAEFAFKYFKDYKDMPWAGKVLMAAARINTVFPCKYYKEYVGLKYNGVYLDEKILTYIAKTSPNDIIRVMFFNDKFPKRLTKIILPITAKTEKMGNTLSIILRKYKKEAWVVPVIRTFAKHNKSSTCFYMLRYFKDMWYAEEILEIASKNIKAGTSFVFGMLYMGKKFKKFKLRKGKKYMIMAAQVASEHLFQEFKKISKDMPKEWLRDVCIAAAKSKPEYALEYVKNLKGNVSLAEDILIIAAQAKPELAFKNFEKYMKLFPWSGDILSIAGNLLPKSSNIYFSTKYGKYVRKYVKNQIVRDELLPRFKKAGEIADVLLQKQYQSDQRRPSKKRLGKDKIKDWFSSDKGLKYVLDIHPNWIIPKPSSKYILFQYIVMISRNLYVEGKKLTKKNVQLEYKRILEYRRRYAKVPLFQGRDILFVADFEKYKNGTNRFGKKATLDAIRGQGGKVDFIKPKPSIASLKQKKQDILDKIANTRKLTFLHDGHGETNELVLGKVNGKDVSIGYYALALAFIKRQKKFPNEKSVPIMILTSCKSSSFAKNFLRYAKSRYKDFKPPIILTGSEHNLYGYSHSKSQYGDMFFENILELNKKGQTTTFGTVMRNELKGQSNPCLYIPGKSNGSVKSISSKPTEVRQISKKTTPKKRKANA
ncbi:hypothetical protein ACFL3C_03195 [Patescibacteria group bacterium]